MSQTPTSLAAAAPADDSANAPSVLLGVVTVVLTLVGWSSIPLFLRHFADAIDPWTSNGWRYGFSALVWLPLILIVASKRRLPKGIFRAALVPSIINALGQVCFTWAHYRIDPGLLTFGLRSQLLFVAIGAFIMFPKERALIKTRGYLLGGVLLIIGMLGVLFFDTPDAGEAHATATGAVRGSLGSYLEGVGLAILSGMLFAGYGLAVRKYMHGINPVVAFATICQYTAGVMVALMFVLGDNFGLTVFDMAGDQIAWLLISALIGIAIGHVFYYISIARLGVAISAGVLQLQPFLVAIGSLILFQEILTAMQWVGGVIAVTGAMLMLSVQWAIGRRARQARRLKAAGAAVSE